MHRCILRMQLISMTVSQWLLVRDSLRTDCTSMHLCKSTALHECVSLRCSPVFSTRKRALASHVMPTSPSKQAATK